MLGNGDDAPEAVDGDEKIAINVNDSSKIAVDVTGTSVQQPMPYSPDQADYNLNQSSGSASAPQTENTSPEEQPEPQKKIFGIARSAFALLVVLSIVVIASIVGGSVGGTIAVQRAYNSGGHSDSDTVTASSSSEIGAATTATSSYLSVPTSDVQVALDCPGIDGTTQSVTLGNTTWSYALRCGTDYLSRDVAVDVVGVTAYTLGDCMRACASYASLAGRRDACVGFLFNAQLSELVHAFGGNCWIKNTTVPASTAGAPTNRAVGGLLVTS